MNHRPRFALLTTFLLSLFLAPIAMAQSWQAGASLGKVKQYHYDVGGPIAHSNNSDTGGRVFGGYTFGNGFGMFLSYVDLGTPTYDGPSGSVGGGGGASAESNSAPGTANGTFVVGTFTDSLKATAVDLSVLYSFTPGSQQLVSPFIAVGMFHFIQEVHYRDPSGPYNYRDTGTRLSYGLGAQFKLATAWGLHIGWQRFTKVGDKNNSGHEYNRDMYETGVEYRFGK